MGIGTLDWDGNWSPEQSEVRSLLAAGDTLFVGGQFGLADMVAVKSIAAWDGAQWAAVGDGFEMREDGSTNLGKVHALAYGNNTLYAGGYFNRADGGAVNYIAQHKNGGWSGLGTGVKIEQWSTDTPIDALVFADNQLYVGGNFTAAGGKAIDLIATWDGAAWNEVAGGIPDEGYDQVHALAAGPDFVVAGGYFRLMADKRVDNVSILSGGEWLALGQGVHIDYGDMPGKAYAQAADGQGNIYIGGEFTRSGGVPTKNLAMWDGERWRNIGDADSYVSALAVGGGFLYAGGNFTQIGGVAASHVARMNLQTGQWAPLSSGINGNVKALVYSDGILYAGGDFKAAGTVTAEDVAFWDGAKWHPFGAKARVFEVGDRGGEVGTYVNALAVVGDSVFLGGHFQTIQFGTNTQDLSSFVVVHNVVEWNSATDEWGWVGTGQKPGVTTDGFSGYGTDVYALAIVGNSLFLGGSFNQAGGISATGGLARWDFAGSQWVSIDGSLGGIDDDRVRALAPAGADLIVAGKFTSAGVAATRFIARFDTTTNKWKTLGSGLTWYNDRYLEPYSVLAIPSGIYVAGDFDQAGGKASMGFARWTGELGAPNLTPGQGGAVQAPGVKATFPAGAVGENSVATLAVTAKPAAALPKGWGGLYGLRAAVTTMSGKQLGATAKAYTLQATFTDAQLAAAGIKDATTLQLVAWDGTAWQSIQNCTGCGVDVQRKIVTGATKGLQPLAIVGVVPEGQDSSFNVYMPAITR
jgi:hypothetical protein